MTGIKGKGIINDNLKIFNLTGYNAIKCFGKLIVKWILKGKKH